MIDIALSVIVAYGTCFLAEEALHGLVSPVIAVVVAGIIVGNYGSSGRVSATSANMIVIFWEFTAFSINSAIFLLVGLEVQIHTFTDYFGPVLLAIGTVLLARAAVVYLPRLVNNWMGGKLSLNWAHVVFWGGMRGAVSIALALSISPLIETREMLETLTFGFVLFSVVIQGLSINRLLRWLGLCRRSEKQQEFEAGLAKLAAAEAAISAIDRMHGEHVMAKQPSERLKHFFEHWIDEHQYDLMELVREEPGLAETNRQLIQREIAQTQKRALRRLLQRGVISEEIFEEYVRQIDTELAGRGRGGWLLSDEMLESLEESHPPALRAKSS